jgi:hypothetical protein
VILLHPCVAYRGLYHTECSSAENVFMLDFPGCFTFSTDRAPMISLFFDL